MSFSNKNQKPDRPRSALDGTQSRPDDRSIESLRAFVRRKGEIGLDRELPLRAGAGVRDEPSSKFWQAVARARERYKS